MYRESAKSWFQSARGIMKTASGISDPCRKIEHYTDAVVEGTVAGVLADQTGDMVLARRADKLASNATKKQRIAVKLCKR